MTVVRSLCCVIDHDTDLQFGTLSPLKKEKACGQLRKEILIKDTRNKWTEEILYKLLESSQLYRQTWNN